MKKLILAGILAIAMSAHAEEIRLITLDPGHFHAALVQKTRYPQVSPVVHVYAPVGADLDQHLKRIEGFNLGWEEKVYTGPDFLEKMLKEKPATSSSSLATTPARPNTSTPASTPA
jgi:hypothetical protein